VFIARDNDKWIFQNLIMNVQCNLLIITDTYVGQPGGSERHLFNFLKTVSSDFKINAMQLIPTGNPMLEDGVFQGKDNIRLHSRPIVGVRSIAMVKLIIELWLLIRTNKIDVVASYHEKSDIVNFILKCLPGISIKTVSSKRDMGFKLDGYLKKIMHVITPRLKNITCPSQSIADQMISEFSTESKYTHVIKNGVDLKEYRVTNSSQKQALKKKLGILESSNVLTTIGWLKPIKGHKYLLEAFAIFNSKINEEWILILLGEGELRGELEKQAEKLGIAKNVMFAGVQKNVQDWLGASDLAVTATLSEGLSNALIEACASGLPVVATNVGGNPEIVEHNGNGLLVEAEDSAGLASALLEVASTTEMKMRMGTYSRKKAEVEFSTVSMTNQLEKLYLSLKFKCNNPIKSIVRKIGSGAKNWVKYTLALVCHYSGYNYLSIKMSRAHYILMMHRFDDNPDQLNISLPESYLINVINWSSQYGSIVTLSEMLGSQSPAVRVSLTFDDGYKNIKPLKNISYLGKIIPATVYLSTIFMDSKAELWAVDLEAMINNTQEPFLDLQKYNLGAYPLYSKHQKNKCLTALNKLLKNMHPKTIKKMVDNIHEELKEPFLNRNTFLNWTDVVELSESGIDIGGHTHSHTITSQITEGELSKELAISNDLIKQHIGKSVKHFAYPNGQKKDIADFAIDILKSNNYSSAVTTIEGPNKFGSDPYMLKRFNLSKSRIESPWGSPSKAMYTTLLVNPLKFH